jgi:hypothetical protein
VLRAPPSPLEPNPQPPRHARRVKARMKHQLARVHSSDGGATDHRAQVLVNPTQVYVNPTQVCVNPTQVYVNPTQVPAVREPRRESAEERAASDRYLNARQGWERFQFDTSKQVEGEDDPLGADPHPTPAVTPRGVGTNQLRCARNQHQHPEQRYTKLRIVTLGFGTGRPETVLERGTKPNPKRSRRDVYPCSTGYTRVERNRWASRNGRVSPPPLFRFATFASLHIRTRWPLPPLTGGAGGMFFCRSGVETW